MLGVADGVLLGFGSDIDPGALRGARLRRVTEHSARRDEFELALARLALDEGLAGARHLRWMQLLNVVLGGTLLADVAPHPCGDWERWALVRAAVLQEDPVPSIRDTRWTSRPLAPGSALGAGATWVNSYHHQGVARLGVGVEPVAWADDGIVEALELEGDAWVLGVQWELQESWKEDARMLGGFADFAAAAGLRSRLLPD